MPAATDQLETGVSWFGSREEEPGPRPPPVPDPIIEPDDPLYVYNPPESEFGPDHLGPYEAGETDPPPPPVPDPSPAPPEPPAANARASGVAA
jgi:hypothetical protein